MNRRFVLLWGVATLLVVGLVATVAYQAGLSAQLATAGGTYVVAPHVVGFGFFGLLPLLFILLIVFGLFRVGRGWYGRGWYGMYGRGYRGLPPTFDQWHRQAHGQPPVETSGESAGQPATQTPPPPADDDPWR